MPKKILPQTNIDNNDEVEEIEETEQEIKETKYTKLLNLYKSNSEDFKVTLYKKAVSGKGREYITEYDSEIPPQQEIRDKFGAGKYRIMLHDDNGKFIDSADVNIANLDISENLKNEPDNNRLLMLNELKIMSEILGSKPDKKDDSNMIMELAKMQQKQSEALMKFQIDSNEKMTNLIMSMQSKKPALSEILEVVQFVDQLKGDSGEKTTIDSLLSNPVIQSFIPELLNKLTPSKTVQTSPLSNITHPVITQKITVSDFINNLPENLIEKITIENHIKIIDDLWENNKNIPGLEKSTIEAGINEILSQKEKK